MEPFDLTRPGIARVWDYWLGGKDNFAVDREQKMLEVHPPSAQMARENRQFLGRAVGYVAARGVRQFIDVSAGLPTAVSTHDTAKEINLDVRVAYVDNDPIVISHAQPARQEPGVIAVPRQLPGHLRRFWQPVRGGELHLGNTPPRGCTSTLRRTSWVLRRP